VIRLLLILPLSSGSSRFRRLLDSDPGIDALEQIPETWSDIVGALNGFSPDVVLLGRTVLEADGITIAGDIMRTQGERAPAVIIVSDSYHERDVVLAAQAGVRGYLVGSPGGCPWGAMLRAVASGGGWLSPLAARALLDEFRTGPPRWREVRQRVSLTERELSVVRLVARGCSNQEVAGELGLSQSTIKTHVSRVLAKLDLRSRTQLAAFARDTGIV